MMWKYYGANVTRKLPLVADLKSSGPDIPKLNAVSEFSLAKPSTLLTSTKASAAAVKASPESCYPEAYIAKCTCMPPKDSIVLGYDMCYGACVKLATTPSLCGGEIDFKWLDSLIKTGKAAWAAIKIFGKDAWTVLTNPAELTKSLWRDTKIIANHLKDSWTLFQERAEPVVSDIKEEAGDKWDDIAKKKTDTCGGQKYNPDKDCCLNKKPFSRNRMEDISDCTKRYQAGLSTPNGCSADWRARILLENKLARPYSADDPVGAGPTSFRGACNTHDRCYDDCTWMMPTMPGRKAKDDSEFRSSCDSQFQVDMLRTCKEAKDTMYKDCDKPKDKTGVEGCKNNVDKLINLCNGKGFAHLYYLGVQKYGQDNYNTGQEERCTCCPPK